MKSKLKPLIFLDMDTLIQDEKININILAALRTANLDSIVLFDNLEGDKTKYRDDLIEYMHQANLFPDVLLSKEDSGEVTNPEKKLMCGVLEAFLNKNPGWKLRQIMVINKDEKVLSDIKALKNITPSSELEGPKLRIKTVLLTTQTSSKEYMESMFTARSAHLIQSLSKYIDRIQAGGSYQSGFIYGTANRALNREANYKLALEMRNQLVAGVPVEEVFKNKKAILGLREKIIADQKIAQDPKFVDRGINSKELNKIISEGIGHQSIFKAIKEKVSKLVSSSKKDETAVVASTKANNMK